MLLFRVAFHPRSRSYRIRDILRSRFLSPRPVPGIRSTSTIDIPKSRLKHRSLRTLLDPPPLRPLLSTLVSISSCSYCSLVVTWNFGVFVADVDIIISRPNHNTKSTSVGLQPFCKLSRHQGLRSRCTQTRPSSLPSRAFTCCTSCVEFRDRKVSPLLFANCEP